MSQTLTYDAICFDLFGTLVNGDGVAYPGVVDALELLPRSRWSIVTSCGTAMAQALVRRAGLPEPTYVITSDDVEQTKPAGDPYALAVVRLGVAPSRALAVEDSREGLAAARAAGLDAVAILHGRGVAFARDAIYVVERFRDLHFRLDAHGSIGCTIEP